jgi:RNA polymerase sigma factor (sigma-70 family)
MVHKESSPESRLVARMRAGDEAAARTLWLTHAPRLTAYADAVLGPYERAVGADVVQQAFLEILRMPRRHAREIADPGAWLLRVTRNLALNRVRSIRRERRRLGMLAAPRAEPPSAEGASALADALAALPRPMREVVALKHAGGLTFDQMATALGISRNTLAARYRRALERLRALVAQTDDTRRREKCVEPQELTHARD